MDASKDFAKHLLEQVMDYDILHDIYKSAHKRDTSTNIRDTIAEAG